MKGHFASQILLCPVTYERISENIPYGPRVWHFAHSVWPANPRGADANPAGPAPTMPTWVRIRVSQSLKRRSIMRTALQFEVNLDEPSEAARGADLFFTVADPDYIRRHRIVV